MFVITKDHLAEDESESCVGHRPTNFNGKKHADPALDDEDAERFKMYDDDGNLYFEGMLSANPDLDGFEPLDEFGITFGCTEIRYLNKATGKWETL